MSIARIDAKLAGMGLAWPTPPAAAGGYDPCVADGDRLLVSGQLPWRDGALTRTGRVPEGVSADDAAEDAACCGLNALSVVRAAIDGDWARFARVLHVRVFVASDPGFTGQAAVANGVSGLLVELLGDAGRHARAAVGCAALPLGSPVEVEMVVRLAS